MTCTEARRLLDSMAPRNAPDPRPANPRPIIPPDPPPPPPDAAPEEPPAEQPATKRRQQSSPDLGDKRVVPRTPDPPIVISRVSSRVARPWTHSVGPASLAGYDLLLVHDRQ